MNSDELVKHFNTVFGLEKWSEKYIVDAETYGYCCQAILDYARNKHNYTMIANGIWSLNIAVGFDNGIMFKNVELILEKK